MENILFDPLDKMTVSLFHGTANSLFSRVPKTWRELSQVTGSMLIHSTRLLNNQIFDINKEGKFSLSATVEKKFR